MDKMMREALIGLTKAGISLIPFAGGAINEAMFEIRGRIAQRRINEFVESFLSYLNEIGVNLNEDVITSDEFNDIYMSIIRRVADIKSEHKLRIFREILAANGVSMYQSDFRETFLDMVTKLDFLEIEILKLFENTGRSGSMDIVKGSAGTVVTLTTDSHKEKIIEKIQQESPHFSSLEAHGKYEFYICDLISKALLIDTKTVGATLKDIGREGLKFLYITDFGKEFLKFIRNN
jgi:hypothetical protein